MNKNFNYLIFVYIAVGSVYYDTVRCFFTFLKQKNGCWDDNTDKDINVWLDFFITTLTYDNLSSIGFPKMER